MLASSENAEDLNVLRDLIESGQVVPAIDRTYPLGETPAAIRQPTRRSALGASSPSPSDRSGPGPTFCVREVVRRTASSLRAGRLRSRALLTLLRRRAPKHTRRVPLHDSSVTTRVPSPLALQLPHVQRGDSERSPRPAHPSWPVSLERPRTGSSQVPPSA